MRSFSLQTATQQLLTVTAIPAFPTSAPPFSRPNAPEWHAPPDLVVIPAIKINALLPSLLTAAMALGMVIADWSLHMPWEYRLLRTRNRWKMSHLAYFASRLGGVAFSVAAVLGHFVGNMNPGDPSLGAERWDYANAACMAERKVALFFSMVSVAGSTGILLLRCLALWRFKLSICIPLGLLWLSTPVLMAVNMANLQSVSRRNGIGVCQPLPPRLDASPVLSYMPWFLVPIFDSAILILSLIGLHRATAKRGASPLERMFRVDNTFYYLGTLITVLPIPIWYLAQGRDGRMMPYINVYIGLSSVLSCRIFINLWKAIGKELALAQTFGDTEEQEQTHQTASGRGGITTLAQRSVHHDISQVDYQDGEVVAETDSSSKEMGFASSQDSVEREKEPDWTRIDPDLAFSVDRRPSP